MTVRGVLHLSAWLKSNTFQPTVIFSIDGNDIDRSKTPGDYRSTLDTAQYTAGAHTLRIAAYDPKSHPKGKKVGQLEVNVIFAQ
jgi:hypothetical protein